MTRTLVLSKRSDSYYAMVVCLLSEYYQYLCGAVLVKNLYYSVSSRTSTGDKAVVKSNSSAEFLCVHLLVACKIFRMLCLYNEVNNNYCISTIKQCHSITACK